LEAGLAASELSAAVKSAGLFGTPAAAARARPWDERRAFAGFVGVLLMVEI
jgi:hypothetical protein